jgi:fatty acid desaturase
MSPSVRSVSRDSFRHSELISAARLRELSRLNPAAMLVRVGFDYLVIALTIFLASRYHRLDAYLLAVMIIGARQVGIGTTALHEGTHHLLFRNRCANDFFSRAVLWSVLAPVAGFTLESFRENHLVHHRTVNTPADPDYRFFERWYGWPRIRMVALYMQMLLGISFLLYAFYTFKALPARAKVIRLTGIVILIVGLALQIRFFEMFVVYWLIPIATWGFFVNFLRSAAEHHTPGSYRDDAHVPAIYRTAEIINSPFDSLFVVTRGLNYHLSHHLFPSVPFYRIKALQRDLRHAEEYRRFSHVTYGYHRYLIEFFGRDRGRGAERLETEYRAEMGMSGGKRANASRGG